MYTDTSYSYRWVPTTCNGRSRELVINVLSMIHTNFWNVSLRVDWFKVCVLVHQGEKFSLYDYCFVASCPLFVMEE